MAVPPDVYFRKPCEPLRMDTSVPRPSSLLSLFPCLPSPETHSPLYQSTSYTRALFYPSPFILITFHFSHFLPNLFHSTPFTFHTFYAHIYSRGALT